MITIHWSHYAINGVVVSDGIEGGDFHEQHINGCPATSLRSKWRCRLLTPQIAIFALQKSWLFISILPPARANRPVRASFHIRVSRPKIVQQETIMASGSSDFERGAANELCQLMKRWNPYIAELRTALAFRILDSRRDANRKRRANDLGREQPITSSAGHGAHANMPSTY